MDNENNGHLSVDQLLEAVVDEKALTPEIQRHMVACPRCKAEKEKIDRQLDGLSQMAKQMAPLPMRSIVLPEEKTGSFRRWHLRLKPAFGIAAALCLVVIAVWWSGKLRSDPMLDHVVMNQEIPETEQVLINFGTILENALPQAYQEVLAVFETESEEDFMQFIVPTTEPDNPTSLLPIKEDEIC